MGAVANTDLIRMVVLLLADNEVYKATSLHVGGWLTMMALSEGVCKCTFAKR